jgi:hypothetical protein
MASTAIRIYSLFASRLSGNGILVGCDELTGSAAISPWSGSGVCQHLFAGAYEEQLPPAWTASPKMPPDSNTDAQAGLAPTGPTAANGIVPKEYAQPVTGMVTEDMPLALARMHLSASSLYESSAGSSSHLEWPVKWDAGLAHVKLHAPASGLSSGMLDSPM